MELKEIPYIEAVWHPLPSVARQFAATVRGDDLLEQCAVQGVAVLPLKDIEDQLMDSAVQSELSWAVFYKGWRLCLGGISVTDSPDIFNVWQIGTGMCAQAPVAYTKFTKLLSDALAREFGTLTNFTLAENLTTQRWLTNCGFIFDDQPVTVDDVTWWRFFKTGIEPCVGKTSDKTFQRH